MNRVSLPILVLALTALPQIATAKHFRENDNSQNNACAYVHNWYLHAKRKHAVYVSTGGVAYGARLTKVGRCQAGDADTKEAAKTYALQQCEALRRKAGIKEACKVVESR